MNSITHDYWEQVDYFFGEIDENLNQLSDRFSANVALPFIKYSYHKIGECVSSSLGFFSESLQQKAATLWYDPFSTSSILKITKLVEGLSLSLAVMKPLPRENSSPFYIRYLDVSLISTAQHLHSYTKEVNYLLSLSTTIKYYIGSISFDRFINNLSNFFGRAWTVIGKVILALKYISLNLINLALKTVEVVLSILSLYHFVILIGYLRDTVNLASQKIHSKFSEIIAQKIDQYEETIRQDVTKSTSDYVTNTVVTTFNRAALKTAVSVSFFFGAKMVLRPFVNESAINFVGLLSAGALIWKNVLKPELVSYYTSYNPDYDPNASNLKEFCKRYDLTIYYPSLKTFQIYSKNTPRL